MTREHQESVSDLHRHTQARQAQYVFQAKKRKFIVFLKEASDIQRAL